MLFLWLCPSFIYCALTFCSSLVPWEPLARRLAGYQSAMLITRTLLIPRRSSALFRACSAHQPVFRTQKEHMMTCLTLWELIASISLKAVLLRLAVEPSPVIAFGTSRSICSVEFHQLCSSPHGKHGSLDPRHSACSCCGGPCSTEPVTPS